MYASGDGGFHLLNDLPIDDRFPDLLGTSQVASRLADLVHDSRGNTPFVLAIQGGWGTGKSTLMRQLAADLRARNEVRVAWFNAWTASGVSALKGVLKLVLEQVDRSIVRRSFNRLRHNGILTDSLRLGLTVVAGFFRADRALDQLWERMSVDASAPDDARRIIAEAITGWAGKAGAPSRTIVVFVDDLDRCDDLTVVEICEVIKLYLDVPGVAFVLGFDIAVLERVTLAGADRPAHVRHYLEKIIQVSYQIPAPAEATTRGMIEGYAQRSGTSELFTEPLVRLVGRQSLGNPRRVKRLINSFVTEYQVDPQWRDSATDDLMKAVVLQHFYPEFYQEIVHTTGDVVLDVLSYRQARDWLREGGQSSEPIHVTLEVLHRWKVPRPADPDQAAWQGCLAQLDERIPRGLRMLVDNDDFLDLLREFGDAAERLRLQERLRLRPLRTMPTAWEQDIGPRKDLSGLRLLWIDDHPEGNETLINAFMHRGAQIRTALDGTSARRTYSVFLPDAVISDVERGGEEVGFDDLRALREAGFAGPVLFFTGRVSPPLVAMAAAVGGTITASNPDVVAWIESVARTLRQSPDGSGLRAER
ncbi:P-loop NTPase fold protein [Dactylosporangium sp. NPDC051541]|uniref:P-loop NTPase fold protein n=1 Tax=Dactylosporangium sp. NPDC051541 TaxID=3363977 RepID=UPI0037BAB52D